MAECDTLSQGRGDIQNKKPAQGGFFGEMQLLRSKRHSVLGPIDCGRSISSPR